MNAHRNRARGLCTKIVHHGTEWDLVDAGRIRGRAPRDRRLRELLDHLEIHELVGDGRIWRLGEIENLCALGDGAGRDRGKTKHYLLYTGWM